MGNTFRRDSVFRPQKHGRVFRRDKKPSNKKFKPWDKDKDRDNPFPTTDMPTENFGS